MKRIGKTWQGIACMFILALFAIVTIATKQASAVDEDKVTADGDFQYRILFDEAYITGYIGTDTEVIVPGEIEGFPVCSMTDTFCDNDKVEKVTISEGIKTLQHCFRNCANLKEVNFPGTLQNQDVMGEPSADVIFCGCKALTNVTYEKCSNNEIKGQYSFEDGVIYYTDKKGVEKVLCRYLESNTAENYQIPKGGCFLNSSFQSVELCEGITHIGAYAFSGENITSIEIPKSVTHLGEGAFAALTNVKKITVSDSVVKIAGGSRVFPADAEICCYEYSPAWKHAKKYKNPVELISVNSSCIKNLKKKSNGIQIKCKVPAGVDGVILYRANRKGKYRKIAELKGNGIASFLDKDVKKGNRYQYYVKSYRNEKYGKALSKRPKVKQIVV